MEEYTNQILRVVVAQICQAIGWHTSQSTPLELLTDILHKYIQELSVRTFRYTQLYSRTDANLDDVGLAFRDLGINIPDLLEYINNVDSVPCAVDVPRYPVRKESSLNFLKPGSKEVITRPVYVHEYLPPVHPEKEDDGSGFSDQAATGQKIANTVSDPSSVITDITHTTVNNTNIINNNNKTIFKRPDICELTTSYKKSRFLHEDEGRPTREISSVMMTSSGFISPAREGKLPDSKTPVIPDYRPMRSVTPPHAAVAATPPMVTIASTSAASTPIAGKIEKKSKRQKNTTAGSTETKEQRRRERHLAKMQKRKSDSETVKPPGKRAKIREGKAKQHAARASAVSPQQSVSSSVFETLPPVSLPSDLTIKSETVPVASLYPTSALSHVSSTTSAAQLGGADKKSSVASDEIKLNSELDKQKYSIFKKISSKKSREDVQKGLSMGSMPQVELYSGFPTLPESTTIRRVPTVKFDSPPHTDPNIIVVDDDSPPRISSSPLIPGTLGSQLLSMSPLPAGTTATASPGYQPPFSDSAFMHVRPSQAAVEPTKKPQRKPRKNKQQALVEQSAPLNLSSVPSTSKGIQAIGNNNPAAMPAKAPRKRQNKVGRPSKRAASAKMNLPPGFPPGMGMPPMGLEAMKRDDMSPLNMFKANSNQFLTGMNRFPLLNAFHLFAGPGLIPNPNFMHPSSNLLPFSNQFGYNEFMGLRPPIRPSKIDKMPSTSPPPPLPLDLESNVYCNVPPLVPDSLKLQLSPGLGSRGNKSGGSSATTTLGSSYSSLKSANTKMESPNLSIFQSSVGASTTSKSPKILDAPIEISDDDKSVTKSDTEGDRAPPDSTSLANSRGNSGNELLVNVSPFDLAATNNHEHSPNKNANGQRLNEPKTTMEINDAVELNRDGDLANVNSNMSDEMPPVVAGSATVKGDKKREKEHKKGKRGKDGKIKKKKDKKDKAKSKEKAEKRKEEKKEKDRSKKKKEKRKDKGRQQQPFAEIDDMKPTSTTSEPLTQHDSGAVSSSSASTIPKLTLKFGSPQSVASDDVQEMKKMSTKSVNGAEDGADNIGIDERRESSPELARISPLVTRPPKQKASTKEKSSDSEQTSSANFNTGPANAPSGNTAVTTRGPGRPSKNATNSAAAGSLSQGQSVAAPGNSAGIAQLASLGTGTDGAGIPGAESKASNDLLPSVVAASATASGSNIGLRSSAKVAGASSAAGSTAKQANTEPIDAEGNQVWICPACGRVDDGTPMIGCDGCDAWYHWVCVGIQVPPDEREDWYCRNCIIKKQEANYYDKKKKRKKKNKAV